MRSSIIQGILRQEKKKRNKKYRSNVTINLRGLEEPIADSEIVKICGKSGKNSM